MKREGKGEYVVGGRGADLVVVFLVLVVER
jgi:hypothetical protein